MIYFLITVLLMVLFLAIYYFLRYRPLYLHTAMQMFSVGFGKYKSYNFKKLNPENALSYIDANKINNVDYIADPFWIKENDTYYLFVESAIDNFGSIDVYSSKDFANWEFGGVAVNDDFHFSYPMVFRYNGNIYMLPETKRDGVVALYSTNKFPYGWYKERILLDEKLLDTTILFYNDKVYLFTVDRDYTLYLYYSDDLLTGEFKEHPASPLGRGEGMRPAGRPIIDGDNIIIPTQSRKRGYGYAIHKLIVTYLDTKKIKYKKGGLWFNPIKNNQFFIHGVHHIDIQKDGDEYKYVFDGRAGIGRAYVRDYKKQSFISFKDDLYTYKRIKENTK